MSGLLSHKSVRITKPTHGAHERKDGAARPSDTLIDRNQQWKHVTKSLINYYSGLATIEHVTAKSTLALCDTIQVPFHEGHQFLGESGFQSTLYAVRDKTKVLAEHHTTLANAIEKTAVVELERVRTDIKAHIASLNEATVLANEVEKEREISSSHLTQLQQGIDTFENSAQHMLPQHDPYITHIQVTQQLEKQVHKENELQTSLIKFQQQQPAFESQIAKAIQDSCVSYDTAKAHSVKEIAAVQAEIKAELQRVAPDAEYKHFASMDSSYLDPNTALRSVEAVTFPGLNHPATIPIRSGPLERKKRFTKSYKESFYVLTPSGYLQERRSSNDTVDKSVVPVFSLFLPECSLGQPAKETDKSHKFHLEGNKAHKSKAGSRFFGKSEHAYSLRARSHSEMLSWWTEIEKLTKDTKLPVAAPIKRGNPINDAVNNVGRPVPVVAPTPTSPVVDHSASVEAREAAEAEEEDEEGGSSAEEEELARTAPSTPAAGLTAADPMAEGLPVYAGTGTTAAEKAGLQEKGAPILGPVAGSGNADLDKPAEASTSKGWFS